LAGFPDEDNLCARIGWQVFLMKKLVCQNWLAGFSNQKTLCQNGLVGCSNEKQFALRLTAEIEPDNF
jgi:hypothetical protein